MWKTYLSLGQNFPLFESLYRLKDCFLQSELRFFTFTKRKY
jgi:hypothetical protein